MKQEILSIDGKLKVKTPVDKKQELLNDLKESMSSQKILTGIVGGVEKLKKNANSPSVAIVWYNDFKIMIPAEECIDIPLDDETDKYQYEHYLLSKRLASEIDFVIKAIQEENQIAVASRMEAMMKKRNVHFFEKNSENEYIITEDSIIETRIVCTTRAGIIVEIFGVETYIPCKELSYQRMQDATQNFFVGERTLVKILSIDRNEETGEVKIDASVKQAYENPYDKAMALYNEEDKYTGTVSMIDHNGVFVSLNGGIDVLCKAPERGIIPTKGSIVTVKITIKNEEEKRLFGLITHVARI